MSISGERAVIGAPGAGIPSTGVAYIFHENDGNTPNDPSDDWWTMEDDVLASDALLYDGFGSSVSIDGAYVAIGAPAKDDACPLNSLCNSGSAYVFRRGSGSPATWSEMAKLLAPDAAGGDEFGTSIAISGDVVVVGAPYHDHASICDGDTDCDVGAAYVFRRDDAGTEDEGDDSFDEDFADEPEESAAEAASRMGYTLNLIGSSPGFVNHHFKD